MPHIISRRITNPHGKGDIQVSLVKEILILLLLSLLPYVNCNITYCFLLSSDILYEGSEGKMSEEK